MTELPEHLDAERHRDTSMFWELAARRIVLGLIALLAVVALFSVFGQSPKETTAAAPAADLQVSAPTHVRGGLFFQGRFTVEAKSGLENATLVLQEGWLENMSINTIEPSPAEEASRDGDLALSYGPLASGDRLVVYMQFQVNPTNVGRRSANVSLYDGETLVATDERTLTVYP
jgi:hypothetical protein